MKFLTRTSLTMGNKNKKNRLSILTFNTLGTPFFAPDITKRYRKIGQLINEGEFDIVCLQEIFTYYHLLIIQKKLNNFPYVCYEKNPFGPRGGLVIFSKLPLSNKNFATYTFPKNMKIPFYTKIAQNGILNALIQPLSIRIFTTHLTSDVVHDLSPKDKYYSLIRNQSQEAAEEINRYTKKNELLILTGDFNIAKHSSLYREFLERSQLYDVFKDINNPTYSTNRIPYFYVAKLADSIDNIFISCPVKFKPIIVEQIFSEQATLSGGKKSYLSDHVALHCILEINEK